MPGAWRGAQPGRDGVRPTCAGYVGERGLTPIPPALGCRRGKGVPGGPEFPQQLRVGVWPGRDRVFPCHSGVGTVGSGNAVLRPEWL